MGEEVKNLGYSEAQILGTVEKIEDLQVTERAALMKGNLDVDTMHQKLVAQHRKANASNERQEQKKRELREITEEHETDLKQLYVIGSSQLDMMIGAVDKNSIPAKNFRRIRSRMKRPDSDTMVEPAQNLIAEPAPVKP
jgi:hypothetical protein